MRRRWARPCGAGATADRGFSTRTRDRSSPVDTTRRKAATILGTILVLLVAVFYVPIMIAQPTVETLNYVADTLLFAASILIGAGPLAARSTVPGNPARDDASSH